MKKKIKNEEINEIVTGLKVACATGIEFVAVVVAIPARIVLALAKGMINVAMKMVGTSDIKPAAHVDSKREDILTEIEDV